MLELLVDRWTPEELPELRRQHELIRSCLSVLGGYADLIEALDAVPFRPIKSGIFLIVRGTIYQLCGAEAPPGLPRYAAALPRRNGVYEWQESWNRLPALCMRLDDGPMVLLERDLRPAEHFASVIHEVLHVQRDSAGSTGAEREYAVRGEEYQILLECSRRNLVPFALLDQILAALHAGHQWGEAARKERLSSACHPH